MNHLRYCLAEEVRRQDLERNVAQYHLVNQAHKNDSPSVLSAVRLPWLNHNYRSVLVSESSGVATLPGNT